MDKQVAADLIAVLGRSTDKALIHKCLLKIRYDLVGRDHAGIELFCRLNGIAPLVRLISKPYERIIDVALSILANCCVSKPCCKQAIALGVVPPLLSILKSIPSVSVQCRACRLLGNLARASNEKICSLAKGIGVAIAALLADTRDVHTLNMAVRAARLLWSEMPFYDEFVRHGGVQKIVQILVVQATRHEATSAADAQRPAAPDLMDIHVRNIQFMETDNSKVFDREILKKEPARTDTDRFGYPAATEPHAKDVGDLIGELMRSLQTLTGRRSYRIVSDVFAVEHSGACIVAFARHDCPLRGVALRILANLARSEPSSAEHLSRADAITATCGLITHAGLQPPLSEQEERYCIVVICFLAGNACNRAKIRISGAFTRIMEIAKSTRCYAVLTSILMGLANFRYDLISIDQMIAGGLVSVLVERLEDMTRDMSDEHEKLVVPDEEESAADGGQQRVEAERNGVRARCSLRDGPYERPCKRRMFEKGSPPSGGGGGGGSICSNPSSPCSSSGRSPGRESELDAAADAGDMDSEYSPVCSDIEDEDGRTSARKRSADDGSAHSSEVMRLIAECSEAEPAGAGAGAAPDEADVAADSDAADDENDDDDDEESDTSKTDASVASYAVPGADARMTSIYLVIDTLCNVSFRIRYATDLGAAPILSTLVRVCRVAYRRRGGQLLPQHWDCYGAPMVLSHIVEQTVNFVPIIKQSIIFRIYEMTQIEEAHVDCFQCIDLKTVGDGLLAKLTAVAETGYGRGEMALLLLRGDPRTQAQIAVVTTYIVSKPKFLHTLLVEHGALYMVMECILCKKSTTVDSADAPTPPAAGDDLAANAASGLTALSRVLDICVATCDANRLEQSDGFDMAAAYATDDADADDTIYFVAGEADASERVAFDRGTLIAFSEVFASMLQNDFREAQEKQIRLRRQTMAGVRYFLDGVRQRSAGGQLRVPSAEHVGAVLEAYDMAQVYMLPELEADVFNMLLHLLAPETALPVFEFAMREHKPQLADIAVAYYLGCAVPGARKVEMYRAADDSEFYKEWSQMMLDTVVYTCHSKMGK